MTAIYTLPTAHKANNRTPPGLWPTAAAAVIRNAIDLCHRQRQIGLITGPSGIGKTTAIRAAITALQDDDREAKAVMMTRATEGLQPGLLRIANGIGAAADRHLGGADLHDIVVRRLEHFDGVLVLDEAQFASDALLDGIRNIFDDLDGRREPLGIVLVGTPELALRIEGQSARAVRAFAPLRGRIGVQIALAGLDEDDVAAIAQHVGVTGAAAIKLLTKVAKAPGGLHRVRRLVAQARSAAGGAAIGLTHLQDAAVVAGVMS